TKYETDIYVYTAVKNTDGKTIYCDIFISNVDTKMTLEMIGNENFRKSYSSRIENIESTVAAFSLYLVLKPNTFKYLNYNYYHFKDYKNIWNVHNYTQESWPEAYMLSMGIKKDKDEYGDNITVMTYMHFDEVEPWANTFNTAAQKNERGQTYEEFKAHKSEVIIKELEKKFPNLRESIQSDHASTPLSYRAYIACYSSAM